jgi:hypothetical protein
MKSSYLSQGRLSGGVSGSYPELERNWVSEWESFGKAGELEADVLPHIFRSHL